MYDRQTFTLWGNLTGEPVVGKMAAGDIRLKMLPMTLTTWGAWKKLFPGTKVLHLDPDYGKRWNFQYNPGAADRARSGVSFPVWQKSNLLKRESEIYGVRIEGSAKAFLMEKLIKERVVNDHVGSVPVVLITDPETESIRAYERSDLFFQSDPRTGEIRDKSKMHWNMREEALVSGQLKLKRIAGHVALWFAWYGFFPHTEVYK